MVEELLQYFQLHARDLEWRHNPTPYRVWVSEIMLQQTRVEAVKAYYHRFMHEVPDVETLAKLPEDRLFKLWEGLGYYSRARNLQKAAKLIAAAGKFPDTLETILELPGIGPYTAGAIASIAFGLPEPAVDGNVLRVLARLHGHDHTVPEAAEELRPVYPKDQASLFTQSLMELGATVCLPNGKPLCHQCPLAKECAALRENRIGELPHKPEKKPRKIEQKTILLLEFEGKFALKRRPDKGLLAKLWSLPECKENPEEMLKKAGFQIERITNLPDSKHIFTHIEWHMKNIRFLLKAPLPENEYTWATRKELQKKYAIPAAYSAPVNAALKLSGDPCVSGV